MRLKYLLETGDIATHIGQLSAQTDDLDATRAAAEQDDLDHEKAWSQTT